MTDDKETPELFGAWLEETRKLQIEAYGNDPAAIKDQPLRDYMIWNHTAAVIELGECIEEVNWKPWAKWSEGDPVVRDKKAFLKEAVDSLHFIANMLVAGEVTREELNEVYIGKMQVNRERQLRKGGYISETGIDKCLGCRRSFDDVGKSTALEGHCLTCEAEAMRERGF